MYGVYDAFTFLTTKHRIVHFVCISSTYFIDSGSFFACHVLEIRRSALIMKTECSTRGVYTTEGDAHRTKQQNEISFEISSNLALTENNVGPRRSYRALPHDGQSLLEGQNMQSHSYITLSRNSTQEPFKL